jgi:hypothetical protein
MPRAKAAVGGDIEGSPEKKGTKAAPVKPKTKRGVSKGLTNWARACQNCGYMQKGEGFKPVPKKGSSEYARVRREYERLGGSSQ